MAQPATRGPREHVTACTPCDPKEPLVYVEQQRGDGKAPFRDKRWDHKKRQHYYVYFGENCGGDFIIKLSEDIEEQINDAIDGTTELLPDTNAEFMKAEVKRQVDRIFEEDDATPQPICRRYAIRIKARQYLSRRRLSPRLLGKEYPFPVFPDDVGTRLRGTRSRPVVTRIVHNDDLKVGVCLYEGGFYRRSYLVLLIVSGDHDRYARR